MQDKVADHNHTTIHRTYYTGKRQARLVAPAVLPASSPPLFPLRAVELFLPKFPVDIVMRLTHPLPKFLPAFRPDFILDHEFLEVLGTDPTRI
jgi:hypothetical protein